MKNAVILLEKGDVVVRTKHLDTETIEWIDGAKPLREVLSLGYSVKENSLVKVLNNLESLRTDVCWGHKATNKELLEIIELLREY